MHPLKKTLRALTPAPLLSLYHLSLAYLGAFYYRYPSRKLCVIAVTGTKGKTSTTEMVNAVFEAGGYKTALLNSIRMKIGDTSGPNPAGRSMPGRFFIQRFLDQALKAGCTAAIVEMTSEGARQHRHRFIELDALIFTNLAPEHIESHGSYEAYADAKFSIGLQLARSVKRPRVIVANGDDVEGTRYLALPVEKRIPFSLSAHTPWHVDEEGGHFMFNGIDVATSFPGEFSLRNALAAAELGYAFGITPEKIANGIAQLKNIPGRAERVECGQDFLVVVDYAHTPDSLKALCDAYAGRRKICLLGSAGGGRDTWKRPVVGKVAEENAEHVILTNDDPYDEDPLRILHEIAAGMKTKPDIIPDRREAIRAGLRIAKKDDVVLITGKGVDPIAGPGGTKIPWSDVDVAREELQKLLRGEDIMHA